MESEASVAFSRRWRVWLGLTAFLCAAYFFGGAMANQNARLDPIYAFVEPGTADSGTFRIDRFVLQRGSPKRLDWAFHDGHYYSNKAPGTIWLGALAYKLTLAVERLVGLSFDAPRVVIANAYLINLAVSVLPLVVGAISMFELALALAGCVTQATWVACATTFGTLWFPYSTQLWGHTSAAAFAAMALVHAQRATPRSAVFAGCLAALAVCTDYLAILSALAVSLWLLLSHARLVPRLLLGAAPLALAMLGYHTICFGGPFVTASQLSNPVYLDEGRALGMFGSVSSTALWELTFGLRRGLFVQCPVLLLVPLGFVYWLRRSPRDPLPYICLATSTLYVLVNASFNGWHGGSTVGARYLICALPFIGLALAALPWRGWFVWAATGLLTFSTFNMLAIAAVNPLAPDELSNPLYGYTYDMFFAGKLSPYRTSFRTLSSDPGWEAVADFSMWNWGQLLGLQGLTSLVPLVLGVAVLSAWSLLGKRRASQPPLPQL